MKNCMNRTGDKFVSIPPYDSDILIEVDDDQFWCVVCWAVKDLSIGAVASLDIGGWACAYHTPAEIAQNPIRQANDRLSKNTPDD